MLQESVGRLLLIDIDEVKEICIGFISHKH